MLKWTRVGIVLLCAAWTLPVLGQTRATSADLGGTVLDESKAVLPGATVTATNPATNLARSVMTDGVGRFTLPALPPGTYSVKIELSGFAPQTHDQVTLRLGTATTLDITLSIASAQAQVTVTGEAPVVDTQATAVSTVVSQQQIESLPINGRDFISFSVVTPGVSTDRTPQQGASATSGLTFAGQRARSNNITVDGLDNNDSTIGSVRATFSQEAVREFQVITNSFSAEFGKASGGVVNIVTKSGSNKPAGNLFLFYRDAKLNSKGYFEQNAPDGTAITRDKAPFSQKQFGGIFGGPIVKDHTFVFASFERLDVQTSNFVTIDDTTPISLFGQPLGTTAAVLRRAGFPVEIGNVPYAVRSDAFLVKLDHQLSGNQSLVVRVNYADGYNENIEPWGGLVARSRGAALDSTDNMLAASHTAVVSSKLVNELRFQFARRDQKVNSLDPNCGGACLANNQGGPTIEVLGVASVGRQRFTPQPRLNDRYQVLDTISWFKGSHEIKAGFDLNYIDHKTQALPLHFGGRYLFSALPAIPGVLPAPVTGIQALALGLPAAYVQGYGNDSVAYGYKDLSLFAQDDWRIGPNVTVKAGIRLQRQFWPDVLSYTTPGYPGSFTFPANGNNIAPRLAFAWDPTGTKKTQVHGSYGLFYDNIFTAAASISAIVDGSPTGLRTLAVRFPTTLAAWAAPKHQLPEAAAGIFPSLVIAADPGTKTPYAHHASVGIDQDLGGQVSLAVNYIVVRGYDQLGTIDYNPVVPALGASRRPLDIGGRAGTSASVLQYTSFGRTWYDGVTISLAKRLGNHHQFLTAYTISKAEDNSTDYQSAFIPQVSGLGRDPNNLTGLPLGFDPLAENGPSPQDQRHRFVLSGLYVAPYAIHISGILTVGSGRPYNILAGVDLNGDGDGGTIPSPDRARTNPADITTSVGRNSGTLPSQATMDVRIARRIPLGSRASLDAMFEVFNLFDRANFTEVNNIFGPGAYPSSAAPGFGQFQQAAAPRQIQLGVRIGF